MLRCFSNSCVILVSTALLLATSGCVVAQHQGSSAQPTTVSALWDFLPKASSIAKYEGTRVYPDGSTSTIMHTSYLTRINENGREYLVRTYEEEETTARGVQSNEVTTVYEVTSGHIAVVSAQITEQGVTGQFKGRMIYDPPWVLLQWPLRQGNRWKQSSLFRMERDLNSLKSPRNISSVIRGEETAHTSAGEFRTWRIEQTVREDKEKFTYWWAKGRWIVKWQSKGRQNTSLELVDFRQLEP